MSRVALFSYCARILTSTSVAEKLALVHELERGMPGGAFEATIDDVDLVDNMNLPLHPGRPVRPRLVSPRDVPTRGFGSERGRAALIHAIAHIEFNAIHLAIDASARFQSMPAAYHRDWIGVAIEEAHHFELLAACLAARGYAYGDFDAHDGLWDMARKTVDDVVARMALVPRVMEARGLDVTPALRARFAQAGDTEAARILDVILADEIGHVAIGNHWFHWICAERALDPIATAATLAARHAAPVTRPPINTAARLAGGFSEAEVAALVERAGAKPA